MSVLEPTPPRAGADDGWQGVGNGPLTARQAQVLLHCVAKGYYEIPRRVTLRALAKEIGISAPSLSLILRRAEGKLVKDHARQLGRAPAALVDAVVRPRA